MLVLPFALVFYSLYGQPSSGTDAEKPLVKSRIVVLEGKFVPSTRVVKGSTEVITPDSCIIRFKLAPWQKSLEWRQLGNPVFDKANGKCGTAFEEGIPDKYATERDRRAVSVPEELYGKTGKINHAVGTPNAAPSTRSALSGWSEGSLEVWWQDPIFIPVSEVKIYIGWYWGTSRSCAELGSGYAIEWVAATGWTYVLGGYEGTVESCNVTGYQKVTSHRNDLFPGCSPANPMYADYNPVGAFGSLDGYLYGDVNTYTRGGECRYLLYPRSRLTRITDSIVW